MDIKKRQKDILIHQTNMDDSYVVNLDTGEIIKNYAVYHKAPPNDPNLPVTVMSPFSIEDIND